MIASFLILLALLTSLEIIVYFIVLWATRFIKEKVHKVYNGILTTQSLKAVCYLLKTRPDCFSVQLTRSRIVVLEKTRCRSLRKYIFEVPHPTNLKTPEEYMAINDEIVKLAEELATKAKDAGYMIALILKDTEDGKALNVVGGNSLEILEATDGLQQIIIEKMRDSGFDVPESEDEDCDMDCENCKDKEVKSKTELN